MTKTKKSFKTPASTPIKCRATHRHLLNGAETKDLQGIRVTVAYSQKRTLNDMAEAINNASSATVADVLAVWNSMEQEIIRTLLDGNRVELGNLGTLSLEVGTTKRKGANEAITGKDIMAKGVTFTPSQRLSNVVSELSFECDGIAAHPLSDTHIEEALAEHFSKCQYINTRTFATVCKCSLSSAYRRIAELESEGKLKRSPIAKGLYERVK